MQTPDARRVGRYVLVLIGFVLVVLLALATRLGVEYQRVREDHVGRQMFRRPVPLTADDANTIASWMTFDYIGHVFGLPPEYLKTSLGITDPQYPRITITRYARDAGLDASIALSDVQDAVRMFLSSSTTSHE